MKRVVVTGGAGQIAYSLLFRIAAGEMLGNTPIALHILDIPEMESSLEGVRMELEDCAFPLLKEIVIGSDPAAVFKGAHYALLVGAKPRGPGMERGDLLRDNAKIFVAQGKALNEAADKSVKVLVVGNPCNTNCLIAQSHAPNIPKNQFFAMTRLDQNRAMAQLALKSKTAVTDITRMAIWGNHSSTQVPDYFNARIKGKPAEEVIRDPKFFQEVFIPKVQKRGAEIIAARSKSSAASAASAAIDSIRSLENPSDEWFSLAVCSENNPYGIDPHLIYSFPCLYKKGGYEIVKNAAMNDTLKHLMKLSEQELIEERQAIHSLLGARK